MARVRVGLGRRWTLSICTHSRCGQSAAAYIRAEKARRCFQLCATDRLVPSSSSSNNIARLRGSCKFSLGPSSSFLASAESKCLLRSAPKLFGVNHHRTRLGSRGILATALNPPPRPSLLLRHLQSLLQPNNSPIDSLLHPFFDPANCQLALAFDHTMSFSSLVSDIAYRKDADRSDDRDDRRPGLSSGRSTTGDSRPGLSSGRSYASTAATSVSITGDIKSQLHGGYSHPLARSWQAERQLTKVGASD